ncbi:tetratricopeptide repeat protein [Pararobbsia silviterrae]|uniref:Tetratricopeptide repeat protein n=1 Tax=Pararobbsia silviterrae TaxID=1792498 RepID=A0A494YCM2_9BURK|nr:tetratricopeptide repeat protein [Pararobbsia silviterrae]RKP58468.1 tetratricopeptide repeat protein [Pararobbsia silviterrae]
MKKTGAKAPGRAPSASAGASSEWQQAVALHRAGRLDEAARLYERAIARDPRHGEAHSLLGLVALKQGDAARAADLLRRATELDPASVGAHANLAAAYKALGDRARALRSYETALSLNPAYVDGWIQAGHLLGELGQPRDALDRYDRALQIDAAHAGAWVGRGITLRRLGAYAQALACFDRVLARDPNRLDARHHRGAVLLELGRDADALAEFDTLLAARPDDGPAWSSRGFALMRLHRDAEAVAAVERAVAVAPHYPPAWVNCGTVMLAQCRYADARAAFERALALAPALVDARWNLANLDLLEGRFDAGWRGFEARWHSRHHETRRHATIPAWLGDASIDGARVLLWHEQGLGDTLQFCRFARDIAARGASPVLEVQPALKRLLSSSLPGIEVIETGAASDTTVAADSSDTTGASRSSSLSDATDMRKTQNANRAYDYAIPLMSLPLALGQTLASVPAEPAYLHADPALCADWAARLGPRSTRLRVGFAISGNSTHRNDANRSIALRAFAPILDRVDAVMLQKGLRDADAHALADYPNVRYIGDAIADFADTAAAIAQCDLVISADTSVAHLAGALGARVWVLVPANPDWRWQLGRDDTPWYASATLFRQTRTGDWGSVFERILRALDSLDAHRRSTPP